MLIVYGYEPLPWSSLTPSDLQLVLDIVVSFNTLSLYALSHSMSRFTETDIKLEILSNI